MQKTIYAVFTMAAFSTVMVSCKKDDPVVTPPSIVKEWTVPLSAKFENPAPAGRTETGSVNLQLLSDNTIKYAITVTGLTSGDALTAAHVHTGNAVTNGPVVVPLSPTFTSSGAGSLSIGVINGLRTTFIDSLKNDVTELYFNVHSTQAPGGIVRGQVNETIEMAADVVLNGANEVPAVTTTATGIALLRLTASKKLYSKVTVNNLEAGDALTAAHIHQAAAGVNGPVIVSLGSNAADFGMAKVATLTDANYALVKTGTIYVNAHSTNHAPGVVRGQVR